MNYHPDNDMTEDEQAHWEALADKAGKGSSASACSPRHEVFCGACDWVGSWDNAIWARFRIPGKGREACKADDRGADPCCPACIRDTLVETDGWEDWQLPPRALLHGENVKDETRSELARRVRKHTT